MSLNVVALESCTRRIRELYGWGHITQEEYLADYAEIQSQLQQTVSATGNEKALKKLALFLKDICRAWEEASQEQRNRLATCLFESVWIGDKKVVAATPRPEFKPFFDLQYQGMSNYVVKKRPRGDLNPRHPD